jgi:hypothetical protein
VHLMPRAAIKATHVDWVLNLVEIGALLSRMG